MGKKKQQSNELLVSILTPTTPLRIEFLKQLRIIIENQTISVNQIEWIVYENNNSRGIPLCEDLVKTFPGRSQYIFTKEKVPIGHIRNVLTENANAPYLVNMDDDDFYFKDRCEHAIKTMKRFKTSLVACTNMFMYDSILGNFQWGPFGLFHGTANTFGFTKEYANKNKFDETVPFGEERMFCQNYKSINGMIQLDPFKTVIQISHTNMYSKRAQILQAMSEKSVTSIKQIKCNLFRYVANSYSQIIYQSRLNYENSLNLYNDVYIYCGHIKMADISVTFQQNLFNLINNLVEQNRFINVFLDTETKSNISPQLSFVTFKNFPLIVEAKTLILFEEDGQWPLLKIYKDSQKKIYLFSKNGYKPEVEVIKKYNQNIIKI